MLPPLKGLYFEVLIQCSMTESITPPELFSTDFCMFEISAE